MHTWIDYCTTRYSDVPCRLYNLDVHVHVHVHYKLMNRGQSRLRTVLAYCRLIFDFTSCIL